jgi:signal transduction histidine kinase/CheY-like chemotaxis protein
LSAKGQQHLAALPSSKTPQPLIWLLITVYAVAVSPYFFPFLPPEVFAEYVDVWVDVPMVGLVAAYALIRRPRTESTRERGFWLAWGIGFGLWFVGRVAWPLLYDLGLAVDLAADFLFQMFYVGILIAIEIDPAGRPPTPFQVKLKRYTLAGGVILMVTGYLYFALIPGLVSPETYESWKPSVVGALVFDLYVAVRLVVRLRQCTSPHWKRVYSLLALAFCWWVVTDALDVLWLYLAISSLEGGNLLDMFWFAPYGLTAVGVLQGRKVRTEALSVTEKREPLVAAGPLGGTGLIAYAFSMLFVHNILQLTGLLDSTLSHLRGALLAAESVIMAVLVFRVYRIIMRENRTLRRRHREVSVSLEIANTELEQRVQERTRDLEEANTLLAEDIEERRRVEALLRSAESRNQALIQAVPDTLVLLDASHRILEVIPGLPGTPPLDLSHRQGQDFLELVPPNSREIILDALDLIGTTSNLPPVPILVQGPRGQEYLELRFGRCGRKETLVLLQDITERRKMELTMQQSQKLESLGVLAGGVAHDFNNLLTSIIGNVQLAREGEPAAGETGRFLGIIEASALRAAKLTGNLLAYAGGAHVELETFDLRNLVRDLESLMGTTVPRLIQLDCQLADEPLWIKGNEAQVSQIILNLVRNGAEAMEGSTGTLELNLASVQVGEEPLPHRVLLEKHRPGPYVCLTVRDTGCGLDERERQRIFDPFYSSKGPGRGLGLAAVLGILSHHEGILTLASTPGQGSCFQAYFPMAADSPQVEVTTPMSEPQQLPGRVLVVDDEEEVRNFVATCLRRFGLEVLLAEDGAQAVDMARDPRSELAAIFMDFSMPKMTGAEAHQLIREFAPRLPMVLMSGFGEAEILSQITLQEHTFFLEKPFEVKRLQELLNRVLGLRIRKAQF